MVAAGSEGWLRHCRYLSARLIPKGAAALASRWVCSAEGRQQLVARMRFLGQALALLLIPSHRLLRTSPHHTLPPPSDVFRHRQRLVDDIDELIRSSVHAFAAEISLLCSLYHHRRLLRGRQIPPTEPLSLSTTSSIGFHTIPTEALISTPKTLC